ncbi:MAG: nucleotidyltransferase domain-containing protein [Gloeobacteraceae cyanobacterium ES-bin-316]|nr:nucleotidyltransferase domain-containing protein [Ferruginibacter sp.]
MLSSVANNLNSIILICEKYGVKSLYLFGSTTNKSFSASSDLDFLVDYFKDADGLPKEPFDYFEVLFSLQKATGKKIDLVVEDALRNSYFKKSLDASKVLIYEKRN